MNRVLDYKNGLRAVVYPIPGVRSVACGFWVGVGSRYEDDATNGISHFTEHVNFKGTDKLTPFDIAHGFESYGANVNAFTSKECTCYYCKSVDEYAEPCFALLADIFFHSTYPPEELDKERKVIVEEINMNEDSPEDLCYDELGAAIYGGTGLGRTILGPAENVMRFTKADVDAFVGKNYSPARTVIAFAGNVTAAHVDTLIRKYVLPEFGRDYPAAVRPQETLGTRRYRERIKPFEQANLALAFPALPFADENSSVQAALNVALGGGMSSRLFQSVREQKGLAYSVYTSPNGYDGVGTFNVYLNISENNTLKALEAVKEEIDAFVRDGITESELERSKIQLKSALVFAGENVQSIMTSAGKLMLLKGELYDIEERIAEIDAVTADKITDLARRIFDYDKMNAAYVGKKTDADVLGVFTK